jgi:hypothetical protein
MREAVIYDMDGTLCDVRGIRHYVMGKKRNFHKFHTESVNCPGNVDVVEAAKADHKAGRAVLIVTARSDEYGTHTAYWLDGQGVEFDKMYMRKSGDYRQDSTVKSEILEQIKKDGYNVVRAYDDNPSIWEVWEQAGIETVRVAGFGFEEDE